MSFHASTSDVSIKNQNGRTYLVGNARRSDGTSTRSEIDLDQYLGNHNGRLDWDAQNFTATAQKVTFGFEGASNVPVLRAELKNLAGVYIPTDKNLGERIKNKEGVFTYVP